MKIKSLYFRYLKYRNPIAYWKKMGGQIGENCEIYRSASFGSEPYLVKIGNHVRINGGVQLITHDGGVWVVRGIKREYYDIDLFGQITIGDNVHIGTNAVIMPGVTVGSNSIIGVGAIVTKDIPENSIAVGVPARVIETIDEYIDKHANDYLHTKYMSDIEKKQNVLTFFKHKENQLE